MMSRWFVVPVLLPVLLAVSLSAFVAPTGNTCANNKGLTCTITGVSTGNLLVITAAVTPVEFDLLP